MLVLAASAPMFADTGTTFGDLMYMPNSSEFLFDNKSYSANGKYSIDRANGSGTATDVYKNERKIGKMNQKLSYSISDYLLVGAGLGFAFQDRNFNDQKRGPNGETRTKEPMVKNSASLTDPSIYARYRLMNTKDHGFVLDLTAGALVNLNPTRFNRAKRGAVTDQNNSTIGNQQRGGAQYNIGAEVGKNFGVFEASASAEYLLGMKARTQRQAVDRFATSNTDPESKSPGYGNVDYNQDSTNDFAFGVKTLTHLYTRWKFGLGADVYYHDKTVNGGVFANGDRYIEETDSYVSTTFNTEIRFVYTRDLYISGGYLYGMNSDYDKKISKNGVVQTQDKYKDDNLIHGGTIQFVAKF